MSSQNRTKTVPSSQATRCLVDLLVPPGSGLGYEMAYWFPSAPSQAQLRDDMGRLQGSLPPGAVSGSLNYLAMRDAYNITNQFLLNLPIAFGIVALVASLATMINLVLAPAMPSSARCTAASRCWRSWSSEHDRHRLRPAQAMAEKPVGHFAPQRGRCRSRAGAP